MLRLAAKYTRLPCDYMGMRRDPELDFLLTMALEIHDTELLCSCGCGQYVEDSRDDDADGYYEVDDSNICYARAAIVRYEKDAGDSAEPGTMLRVYDTRTGEKPAFRQYDPSRPKPNIGGKPAGGDVLLG